MSQLIRPTQILTPGDATKYLDGTGAFTAPSTTGAVSTGKVTRSATAQSLANGVDTAISWDTEAWDTDTMVDVVGHPTRVTITTAGKYRIAASAGFAVNTAGNRFMFLRKNAVVTNLAQDARVPMSGAVTFLWVVAELDLAATDYLEVYVNQGSGVALNVGGDTRTFMTVTSL